MILNVWRPKTKSINGKQIIISYSIVNIDDIYSPGSSNFRVVYRCDGVNCKNRDKIYSISRQHLNEKRSKTVNEKLQICKSCQMLGEKNPNFGNNKSWVENYGEERANKLKNDLSLRVTGDNNPSKRDSVKDKKGQTIINYDSVFKMSGDLGFKLIDIDGDNKFAKLTLSCKKNHTFDIKWINFKLRGLCRYCYYESIRIPFDQINKFEKYSRKVRSLTRFVFNKNKSLIDIDGLKSLYPSDYHIDHIYSISDGFLNNIDPKIISSVNNLRVITKVENLKKGRNSNLTLEKLLELYNKN